MKRSFAGILFLVWVTAITGAYYVVQKPDLILSVNGILDTLWTFMVAALLFFNAYVIGKNILDWMSLQTDEVERLILGTGIGLGAVGLLGLWISAAQIAEASILTTIQIALGIIFLIRKEYRDLSGDLKAFGTVWVESFSQYNIFAKTAILFPFILAFLLTLAHQLEAFDVPLYHLTQPAQVLKDGGIRPFDNFPFWFPNLTENVYLWSLGMGSERASQILHLAWGTLALLLLWHWANKTWNTEVGRKVLLLAAAIPSLPILASWAYADMALIFYSLAALHSLTRYEIGRSSKWLRVAGIMAGLAMGVKYTSFTTPLACGLLILFWRRRNFKQAFIHAAQFSGMALIIAASWYVRNAVVMGNAFYPFVFGGRYWDTFLTEWYAGAGTGIGWNLFEIFKLPLTVVLGYRDETFFDGRIGPLFLALAPLTLWILIKRTPRTSTQNLSLLAIVFFSFLAFAAWTLGVINSSRLWQARLIFPALIPFMLPTALGWEAIEKLDTPKFRIGFLVNALIGIVIALTVFGNSMFVLRRNPLTVAFGIQTREQYIERTIPSYFALIQLMDELPKNANLYSLFEPRSYDLPRNIQSDPIAANFAHNLHLYKTPEEIIQQWKAQGYTHILVYERGMQFMLDNNPDYQSSSLQNAVSETLSLLQLARQTPDQVYSIYRIP